MKINRRGTILVVALVTLLVVTLLAGAVLRGYVQPHRQLRREQDQLQAAVAGRSRPGPGHRPAAARSEIRRRNLESRARVRHADATTRAASSFRVDSRSLNRPDRSESPSKPIIPTTNCAARSPERTLIVPKPPPTDN